MLLASLTLTACSREYHPEYHPETSYTYAQSVTYVKNGIFAAPGRVKDNEPLTLPDASTSPEVPRGHVTSSGAVVIYGDFSGNIYLGR